MLEPQVPLDSFLATYPRESARGTLEAAEAERRQVLERFPLESWPDMPLERYALGQEHSEETYCRWIEFRTLNLGSIRGGSAVKLMIYKYKDRPGWYHSRIYANEGEAWIAVRGAFVDALEKAQKAEWSAIDALTSVLAPAILAKTLAVYFPAEVLPVCATSHICHFLRLLGKPEGNDKTSDVVRLNRALLAALREKSELQGWTTKELERLLYSWAHPGDAPRIFKIAPGKDASRWPECREGGYICVSWDEAGDLREFPDVDAFRSRFAELFGAEYKGYQPTISAKARELWTLRELEPGDLVVANKGISRVVAIGEVIEPGYEWRADRADHRHTVRVRWDESYAAEIDPPERRWALVTVATIRASLAARLLSREPGEGPPVPVLVPVDPIYKEIRDALERKGQVILYGPPGTGKTYAALRFAVWWLLSRAGDRDAARVLSDATAFREGERQLSANLVRLTFHPSYSYEDFIEGFRPVDTGASSLSLRLEDGVFKRVCCDARKNPSRAYLVLVDEINRANVAKVFGEIITALEKDKRGLEITLPQSKDRFTVPPNVFLLGTMNTADRSIKLLDAALRRRFAFVECMPDAETLRGATVGNLPLDAFLEGLNSRIAKREGREKQIGHSFLLENGSPVSDPEEFARRFRQEILPLLQEYCYDDYGVLAEYVGAKLVGKESRVLDQDLLADTDGLLRALEEEFLPEKATA